jgi:hypothetical protein
VVGPFDAVLAAFETLVHPELPALQGRLTSTVNHQEAEFSEAVLGQQSGPISRQGTAVRP